MKQALGFVTITLGAAWLLGGTGAVVSGLDVERQLEDMRAERIADAETRTKDALAALAEDKTEVEANNAAKIEQAREDVENRRQAVKAVEDKHESTLEAKRQELAVATEGGKKRRIKRAESALERATRRRESALRRPQAKLQRAESSLKDAEAAAKERIAAIDARIDAAKKASQEELTALKNPEVTPAGPSVAKPAGAAGLGALLLGLGIMLVSTGRRAAPLVVEEAAVEAAVVAERAPEPEPLSPTIDAPPPSERGPSMMPPIPEITDTAAPNPVA